jgi:hypothetical protein
MFPIGDRVGVCALIGVLYRVSINLKRKIETENSRTILGYFTAKHTIQSQA